MFKYTLYVMSKNSNWFEVDKAGLAKLREGTPKAALLTELVQNAWDTNAARCDISLSCIQGTRYELIVRDDDPEGFKDLSHAYTLFAESGKKDDVEKRGRFNLGEKLVLALCLEAKISSTKGSVFFNGTGRSVSTANGFRTESGSVFVGTIRMGKPEADGMLQEMRRLIPPAHCTTTYNGISIPVRTPLARFETVLPTVIGDHEGILRSSRRKCWVEVYAPLEGEAAAVYEMGIPVVETGDRFHYNVLQKVPLTFDRSSVTPAFLRDLREIVAENTLAHITAEDAQSTWVRVAAASPDASRDLVEKVFTARFGDKAVIYDPSDMEANKRAMNDGRTVVMGGHMSKEEWTNVRAAGIAAPAGKVYTDHKIETSPDGVPWKMAKETTKGMEQVARFAKILARYCFGIEITVEFVSEPTMRHMAACYGSRTLRYNVGTLGYNAFANGLTQALLDLTIHELAHEKALDHWSDAFYKACTFIGSKAAELALVSPKIYCGAGWVPMTAEPWLLQEHMVATW